MKTNKKKTRHTVLVVNKKQTKQTKPKRFVLEVDKNYFNTKNNQELTKAAKLAFRMIEQHFEKDKWDLDLSFKVADVFFYAYREHLENYLLKELFSNPKKGYFLVSIDNRVVIRKKKNV